MLRFTSETTNRFVCYPDRNNIYFTATTAYYAIHLTSQMTDIEKWTIVEDISAASYNYQLFDITLTSGTETLSAATVDLRPEGHWDYEIYGCSGQSFSAILSGSAGTSLEWGIALIDEL